VREGPGATRIDFWVSKYYDRSVKRSDYPLSWLSAVVVVVVAAAAAAAVPGE